VLAQRAPGHAAPRLRAALPLAAAAALAALVALVARGGGGPGADRGTWLLCALLVTAAGLLLARARADAGDRRAWLVLGAAPVLWVAGELVWLLAYEDAGLPPYPSAADGLWLASYAVAAAGIALLVRGRLRADASAAVGLDAAIGAAALGSVVAQAFLGPVVAATEGDLLAAATDLAFPLADLVLVALAVTIAALVGWRPAGPWLAVAAALAAQGLADVLAARSVALGESPPSPLLAAAWPAAWLLLGAAAWSPLVRPSAARCRARGRWRCPCCSPRSRSASSPRAWCGRSTTWPRGSRRWPSGSPLSGSPSPSAPTSSSCTSPAGSP
jgi:hypothetical protein